MFIDCYNSWNRVGYKKHMHIDHRHMVMDVGVYLKDMRACVLIAVRSVYTRIALGLFYAPHECWSCSLLAASLESARMLRSVVLTRSGNVRGDSC